MTSAATAGRRAEPRPAPPPVRRDRRSWTGWGFLGPFVAVFALVFLAPVAYSVYLSLFRDQLIGGTTFVGLDNYGEAARGRRSSGTSLGRVSAASSPCRCRSCSASRCVVALALDSGAAATAAASSASSIFLPYAVPAVVATLMWGFMYGTRFGLVGDINDALGVALLDPLSPDLVAGLHRQHRDLGVRRLQHADLLLGAAGGPARRCTRRPRSTAPASSA